MTSLVRLFLISLATMCLVACGFKLRQSPPLPDGVRGVAIIAPTLQSRLSRDFSEILKIYQIPQLDAQSQSDTSVTINLAPENLERRLLSVFPTGQVAEYELIYSVNYTVTFPGQPPKDSYLEVLREYQDDPNELLAKSRELELVMSEMRKEAADRIIRLLPSQAPQ